MNDHLTKKNSSTGPANAVDSPKTMIHSLSFCADLSGSPHARILSCSIASPCEICDDVASKKRPIKCDQWWAHLPALSGSPHARILSCSTASPCEKCDDVALKKRPTKRPKHGPTMSKFATKPTNHEQIFIKICLACWFCGQFAHGWSSTFTDTFLTTMSVKIEAS